MNLAKNYRMATNNTVVLCSMHYVHCTSVIIIYSVSRQFSGKLVCCHSMCEVFLQLCQHSTCEVFLQLCQHSTCEVFLQLCQHSTCEVFLQLCQHSTCEVFLQLCQHSMCEVFLQLSQHRLQQSHSFTSNVCCPSTSVSSPASRGLPSLTTNTGEVFQPHDESKDPVHSPAMYPRRLSTDSIPIFAGFQKTSLRLPTQHYNALDLPSPRFARKLYHGSADTVTAQQFCRKLQASNTKCEAFETLDQTVY